MIKGGIGGVCRVGVGGCRPGYSQTFLPALVTVGTEIIDAALQGGRSIRYSASVRIRNVAGTDWVDVVDVIYFQVSARADGSGSANLTVRAPDKWSIDGTLYPDLLRPSERVFQVIVTLVVGASSYSTPVFTGQITNYNEAHGQRGGSISLTARSTTIALSNRNTAETPSLTAYRRVQDEMKASGLFAPGQGPVSLWNDYEMEQVLVYNNLLDLLERVPPVAVDISTRSTGGVIQTVSGEELEREAAFTITDDNQISLTRSIGSGNSFNTVTVIGTFEGEITTTTVQDANDVAARGVIRYAPIYGSQTRDLADNIADAEAWIAEMVRGKLSAQLQFNPFLQIGTVLSFSSSRLFISDGKARVQAFNHRFSRGTAETSLSDLAVLS